VRLAIRILSGTRGQSSWVRSIHCLQRTGRPSVLGLTPCLRSTNSPSVMSCRQDIPWAPASSGCGAGLEGLYGNPL
jgi:hypothetical protein